MQELSSFATLFQGVWGYFALIAQLSVSYRYVVNSIIMPQYNDKLSDLQRYYSFIFNYFVQLYNYHYVLHGYLFYKKYVQKNVKREQMIRDLVQLTIVYIFCEVLASIGCAALGYRHIPVVPASFMKPHGDVTDILVLPSQQYIQHCVSMLVLIYDPDIFRKFTKLSLCSVILYQVVFSCFYSSIIRPGQQIGLQQNGMQNCFYFEIAVLMSYYCEEFTPILKKYFIVCDLLAPFIFNTVLTFLTNYAGSLAQLDRSYLLSLGQVAAEYAVGVFFVIFLALLESGRCYHTIYRVKFLCKYVGNCHFYMPYANVLICAFYINLFENIQFGPFHYAIVVQIMFAISFMCITVANCMQSTASQMIRIGRLL